MQMKIRCHYCEDRVYKGLLANRCRRANAFLADYYPSIKGVDFDTQVAPALQVVHALESSYNTYIRVYKDMVDCVEHVDSNWTDKATQLAESISVLENALNAECVKSDHEVSMYISGMLKDVLFWTSFLFRTLANNISIDKDWLQFKAMDDYGNIYGLDD